MEQIIIGAGLAGLIAACHFKDADIWEAGQQQAQHRALLRFRSKAVSELTGIPFKEVLVHKGIYTESDGKFHTQCTIPMANQYAEKVIGQYAGRSIWNLDPVKRYVGPDDMYEQLASRHADRIRFNTRVSWIGKHQTDYQYINTAPLPNIADACHEFDMSGALSCLTERASICVRRYHLPEGTDLNQTVYFPEPGLRLFRASITGRTVIVEFVIPVIDDGLKYADWRDEMINAVAPAFGIDITHFSFDEEVDQKYGKIVDLEKGLREAALYKLTRDYGVFSLGRFATWRNILLDDVAADIKVIDGLINASDYVRARAQAADKILGGNPFGSIDIPF